nr:MAG TPA: hypothetical protein [Caudoviricetes sp.]
MSKNDDLIFFLFFVYISFINRHKKRLHTKHRVQSFDYL